MQCRGCLYVGLVHLACRSAAGGYRLWICGVFLSPVLSVLVGSCVLCEDINIGRFVVGLAGCPGSFDIEDNAVSNFQCMLFDVSSVTVCGKFPRAHEDVNSGLANHGSREAIAALPPSDRSLESCSFNRHGCTSPAAQSTVRALC